MQQSELGIYIAKMRLQKKMTQKELADAINVDIRTIQRIESGKVMPRMYTIKLLSDILGVEIPVEVNNTQSEPDSFRRNIRLSFICSILFSINYIPVIFNSITGSLNPYINVVLVMIHVYSIIFTIRGFYLVGILNNNNILAITSALAMILLPLLSITNLRNSIFYNPGSTYMIFNLACINAIAQGIGFFMKGYQGRKSNKSTLYKIAGVVAIFQSLLFLSVKFEVIVTAAIISSVGNVLAVFLLHAEYKESGEAIEKNSAPAALA